ncbi:MAG: thioredoxin [Ruminococcaceae bacterium]|nr:thioredoxin [Oscillospiraceae bacterium]
MAETVITKENFENEVLKSDIPVLVDFWASWCGPCKMIAPIIEEIAKEYAGTVKVGKINVDDQQELAIKFGIASIPTLLVFRGGEVTDKLVGYRPKEDIEALIN